MTMWLATENSPAQRESEAKGQTRVRTSGLHGGEFRFSGHEFAAEETSDVFTLTAVVHSRNNVCRNVLRGAVAAGDNYFGNGQVTN